MKWLFDINSPFYTGLYIALIVYIHYIANRTYSRLQIYQHQLFVGLPANPDPYFIAYLFAPERGGMHTNLVNLSVLNRLEMGYLEVFSKKDRILQQTTKNPGSGDELNSIDLLIYNYFKIPATLTSLFNLLFSQSKRANWQLDKETLDNSERTYPFLMISFKYFVELVALPLFALFLWWLINHDYYLFHDINVKYSSHSSRRARRNTDGDIGADT